MKMAFDPISFMKMIIDLMMLILVLMIMVIVMMRNLIPKEFIEIVKDL